MLRDNRVGLIELIFTARELDLSRCALNRNQYRTIDPQCLENPRPKGGISTLTENVSSPFHAEPGHDIAPQVQAFTASSPVLATATSVNKPRVYLTAASKGNQWNAARDQSMEMSKDFEKDCPSVRVTINQSVADYTVLLNHIEHGFVRDNQIQVANKDGDLISRTKEGGSIRGNIKKACGIIMADWANR